MKYCEMKEVIARSLGYSVRITYTPKDSLKMHVIRCLLCMDI